MLLFAQVWDKAQCFTMLKIEQAPLFAQNFAPKNWHEVNCFIVCAKFRANSGGEVKRIIVYTNASLFAQNSHHKGGQRSLLKIAHTLLLVQKQIISNWRQIQKFSPKHIFEIKKFTPKRLNKWVINIAFLFTNTLKGGHFCLHLQGAAILFSGSHFVFCLYRGRHIVYMVTMTAWHQHVTFTLTSSRDLIWQGSLSANTPIVSSYSSDRQKARHNMTVLESAGKSLHFIQGLVLMWFYVTHSPFSRG